MTATEIDATIYALYPRKVGRVAALKAIAKAVKVVQKEHGCDALEARRVLYKAVHAYARSPAGQNPDRTLIPHPATWFNRGSYFDDPQEWQHGGNNGNSSNGHFQGKTTQSIAAANRAIDFIAERGRLRRESERDSSIAGEVGDTEAGEAGRRGLLAFGG